MITANELRIGNWLQGTKPFKITRIFNEDIVGLGNEIDNQGDPYIVSGETPCLESIPLTPEILEQCGFEKQSIGGTSYFKHPKCGILEGGIFEDGTMNFMHIAAPCKYLHQLQNLYFALTGKELEVNL